MSSRAAWRLAVRRDHPAARLRCVELFWKLGRRQDALRALTLLQTQLKDSKNRVGQRELLLMQTDFAYFDGRLSEAAALARQALTGTLNGGMDLGPRLIDLLANSAHNDINTFETAFVFDRADVEQKLFPGNHKALFFKHIRDDVILCHRKSYFIFTLFNEMPLIINMKVLIRRLIHTHPSS